MALAVLAVLLVLARAAPPPLEKTADPTDASYVPRPDWYFLFLFELLKFFKGKWETVGTILFPSLAVLVLFLLPFLDRSPDRTARRRLPVLVAGCAAGLVTLALTAKGSRRTRPRSLRRSLRRPRRRR